MDERTSQWSDIDTLKVDPGLSPARDERWLELAVGALKGEVPVFLGYVPFAALIPFDIDYRPDLHPAGRAALNDALARVQAGTAPLMVVYQRGFWFVVSDDYITLFACLACRPEYVPCVFMGEVDHRLVRIERQVDASEVKGLLGMG